LLLEYVIVSVYVCMQFINLRSNKTKWGDRMDLVLLKVV